MAVPLPLAKQSSKPEGLSCFFKARIEKGSEGKPVVEVLPGQASFMISPLLSADSWVIFSAPGTRVERGTLVDVVPLHSWGGNNG